MRLPLFPLVASVVLLGACGPDGTVIGAEGGTVDGPLGARLVFPAGAVRESTSFSIKLATAAARPHPSGGQDAPVFELHPAGFVFDHPVELLLRASSGTCTSAVLGADPDDRWAELPNEPAGEDRVRSRLARLGPVTSTPPSAPALLGRMFWSEGTDILSATLDGADVKVVVSGTPNENVTWGLAVDPLGCQLYWTDNWTDAVYRADFDGGGRELLFQSQDVYSNPAGVAVDPVAGRLFFGEGHLLHAANLDGTQGSVIAAGAVQQSYVTSIAVDPAAQQVYWTDNGQDAVFRAAYDGSGATALYVSADVYSNPGGLSLDLIGGRMFWVEGERIRSANLDGSDVTTVASGQWATSVVAVGAADTLFWTDGGSETVNRLSLEAGSSTVLRTNPDVYSNLRTLAVYVGPSGPSAP